MKNRKFTMKQAYNTMKPSKKKTAKDFADSKNPYAAAYAANSKNPMVSKLLDLKYRIDDYKKTLDDVEDSNKDKLWVMGQISALREGARLDIHQMERANNLWRTYV